MIIKNKIFTKKICLNLLVFLLLTGFCFFVASQYAYAETDLSKGLVPDDGKKELGTYGLNDFILLLVIFSDWILSIVGSLALLAFIAGGVLFLISAGSSEKVNQAKQIIIGAVVGVVIVFVSYSVISFFMSSAGFEHQGFSQWNEAPAIK